MFLEHKEQGEAVPVKVGTLKLSEAIRAGAKRGPQCRGVYYDGAATCAIGAAMYATGHEPRGMSVHDMNAFFTAYVPEGLQQEIFMRNDSGESRESIADWLESQGY